MHMPCIHKTSYAGIWRHFPVGGTEYDGVIIYNNENDINDEYGNFRVNNSDEGQLDLSTDIVRSMDAGVYRCSTECEKLGLVIVLGEKHYLQVYMIE